jgi:hypothetical protein
MLGLGAWLSACPLAQAGLRRSMSTVREAEREQFIIIETKGRLAYRLVCGRSGGGGAPVILHQVTDFIGTMERRFYDFASTSAARQPSDRVAVIAIDDQSIANIGRWPWPRDVHAQLIDQLAAAKAKTIVHTAFFFEPQTDRGPGFHPQDERSARARRRGHGAAAVWASSWARSLPEAEQALDTDAKLAASMTKAGNVLVPSVFVLGEPQGKPDKPLPPYALKSAMDENGGFSVPAVKWQQPIEQIGTAAAGIAPPEPDQ